MDVKSQESNTTSTGLTLSLAGLFVLLLEPTETNIFHDNWLLGALNCVERQHRITANPEEEFNSDFCSVTKTSVLTLNNTPTLATKVFYVCLLGTVICLQTIQIVILFIKETLPVCIKNKLFKFPLNKHLLQWIDVRNDCVTHWSYSCLKHWDTRRHCKCITHYTYDSGYSYGSI